MANKQNKGLLYSVGQKYSNYLKAMPQSDRRISNRMFKRFGWAFFFQTILTALLMLITKLMIDDWGVDAFLMLYEKSLMVYVPVFTAFLTKNAIENKAKISSGSITMTSDASGTCLYSTATNNSTVENG